MGLLLGACAAGSEASDTSLAPSPERPSATTQTATGVGLISTPTTEILTDIDITRDLISWRSASIADRQPAESLPTRLVIDRIEVDAPVVSVGIDEKGRMEVPANVSEVGWYRFGPRPGGRGSAVLTAHVDQAGSGPGVFYDLDFLQEGDTVTVHFEDHAVQSFVVREVERIAKSDLDVIALFARDGDPVVRLITCGGAFNPQIRRYDDNLVITLEPVDGGS
jgi:LPXTG-site transpeptidase (sortase) family protein